MASDSEKRDKERVPIHGQLEGEVMVFQPMMILDISLGGAQVETPFPLQLDSLHEFRLTFGDLSVIVKGRIAYSHVGELGTGLVRYRSGVEFIEPSQHVRTAITAFVETLKGSRHTPAVVDGQIADDGDK